MVENFLYEYAKLIADFADKIDTGKLIGKDGKMINAIKTVIIGCKAKDNTSYRVTVKAIE